MLLNWRKNSETEPRFLPGDTTKRGRQSLQTETPKPDGTSSLKTLKVLESAGLNKEGKKSPLSVAFQESELKFDDVPDFADEAADSYLSLAQAPQLVNKNVGSVLEAPGTAARRASARSRTSKAEASVVEEAATESVPEAPSTATRRASARSRTSKLEPAVAEEAAVESLPEVTLATAVVAVASALEAPGTAARRASARSRTSKAEASVVEEAATESVPEAPSTATRRASARSRTSKLEPAVAEEPARASLISSTAAGSAPVGNDSVLDIDDSNLAQESSTSCSVSTSVRQRTNIFVVKPSTDCFFAEHDQHFFCSISSAINQLSTKRCSCSSCSSSRYSDFALS
jgi:hypothetical protein